MHPIRPIQETEKKYNEGDKKRKGDDDMEIDGGEKRLRGDMQWRKSGGGETTISSVSGLAYLVDCF